MFTFTLPNGADVSATQAKSFLAKLQYACEVILALDSRSIAKLTLGQRMSLVKLAYSNVDRKAIAAAAQGNCQHMTTRTNASSISSMQPLIDEGDEHPDDTEQPEPSKSAPAAKTHLRIVLDGLASRDDDWKITVAWNGVSQPSAIKKRSLSPGHSPEHDDGRKRPSSRPRGERV